MSLRDEDGEQHLVLAVVAALILLVVAGAIGLAVGRNFVHKAAPVAAAQEARPQVAIEDGIVRFRFVAGRSDLPVDDTAALTDLVKSVTPGRHVVVATFYDAADGETLAQRRGLRIRDVLKGLGLPEDKVELRRPVPGAGAVEAARVDVMLVD